jgi:hypothetical protein
LNRQIPWFRVAIEGAVIVGSILLAFGIDAWWDERVERTEEQVVLRQLAAEFADNATQLDSVLAIHHRGLEAAAVLLGVARREVRIDADSLRRLVWTVDQPWTFNAKRGALESMIASGQLGIIRNDSLRVALASWPGVLDDFAEDELWAGEFARGEQFSYLSRVVNWSDIYSPREGSAESLRRLEGDPALGSMMAYRISWFETIQAESQLVTETSEQIRGLIRRSLAAGGG